LVLLLVLVLILSACAASPNELANTPDQEGEVAGFWLGLWHGFIAPFTFVISLFSDNVHIYEIHNNGGWYNFGFLIGLSIIFGGSGGGAARRRRR
jgi:hypothetical protein